MNSLKACLWFMKNVAVEAAQEFINILTYCSNSHYKNSTIYVIKYIKYLEQSISQAIIFHGRLGHCSPNIALFLLPLWTLAMWLTLTNGLIEKNVRRGLKCTCIFGLGLFSFCLCQEKDIPPETLWFQNDDKYKEQT